MLSPALLVPGTGLEPAGSRRFLPAVASGSRPDRSTLAYPGMSNSGTSLAPVQGQKQRHPGSNLSRASGLLPGFQDRCSRSYSSPAAFKPAVHFDDLRPTAGLPLDVVEGPGFEPGLQVWFRQAVDLATVSGVQLQGNSLRVKRPAGYEARCITSCDLAISGEGRIRTFENVRYEPDFEADT